MSKWTLLIAGVAVALVVGFYGGYVFTGISTNAEYHAWQQRKSERDAEMNKLGAERDQLLTENNDLKKQITDVSMERDALKVVVDAGNARVQAAQDVIDQAQKEFENEEAITARPVGADERRRRFCSKLAGLKPPIKCDAAAR